MSLNLRFNPVEHAIKLKIDFPIADSPKIVKFDRDLKFESILDIPYIDCKIPII